MADVIALPGVFEQLRAVAELRWLILKNSLRSKNNRWDLLGIALAWTFSAVFVLGVCGAFFAGTYVFLGKGRPSWMALLFWLIFLFWQFAPVFAAGFGGNFEFKNLLRYPLSRRTFYLLGLGYGLADFGAIACILWILSMVAAACLVKPSVVPALAAVSVIFILLNLTMERLIGSWLEKLLARRKSRELFVGIFVLGMISLNFLNPLLQRTGASARPAILHLLRYFMWLPGSLAGQAVAGGATGTLYRFFIGTLGLCGWLLVTSTFLWIRYSAQYRGEELSETIAPGRTEKHPAGVDLQESWPDFLHGSVAAVAIKEFRYMTRNGLSFLTLFLPPVMSVLFSLQFAGRNSMLKNHSIPVEWFFPSMIAYLILLLVSPAYNSFAYEGAGIQSYFLAPVRFREVLMGKNLFLGLLVFVEISLSLAVLIWYLGLPSAPQFAATIAAAMFAVIGQFTIANWCSLSFPKKIEVGKMRGQRNSGIAVWTAFGVQLLMGGVSAVILLAGKWMDSPWLPCTAFACLTGASIAGYFASLNGLDSLAERKKELLIEALSG